MDIKKYYENYIFESTISINKLLYNVEINKTFEYFMILCCKYNISLFEKINNFYSTNIIDYFSFDLEPPLLTLEVLKKFPFDKYKFGVITFEQDFYRGFDTVVPSRKIFIENGYR